MSEKKEGKIHTGEAVTSPTIGESLQQKAVTLTKKPDYRCIVCGIEWASPNALLTPVGAVTEPAMSLCTDHSMEIANGKVILVAVHRDTPKLPSGQADMTKLIRTGNTASITEKWYSEIFKQPIPDGGVVIVSNDVLSRLKQLQLDLDFVGKEARNVSNDS